MKAADLQRTFQNRDRRPRKMHRQRQQESCGHITKPLKSQGKSGRMQGGIERELELEREASESLIAAQKFIEPTLAIAQALAQIVDPGLAEICQVTRHRSRFAGQRDAGED